MLGGSAGTLAAAGERRRRRGERAGVGCAAEKPLGWLLPKSLPRWSSAFSSRNKCLSAPKAYPPASFSDGSPRTRSPAAAGLSRPGFGTRRPRSHAESPQKRAGGAEGARPPAVLMPRRGGGEPRRHPGVRGAPSPSPGVGRGCLRGEKYN